MEQAIQISKSGGMQINGSARKEKMQILFDIIEIFKILKDIKDANISDRRALASRVDSY